MIVEMPTPVAKRIDGRPARIAALAVLLLAGCKEEKKAPGPVAASPASATQQAKDAAQQSIQSTAAASAKIRFRGVQAYTQATPQRVAVCGQVSPFPDDGNIFVPFVSIVTAQPHGDWTEYQFDHRIGNSTSEASRVYAAIVTYCYDDGGPAPGALRGVTATPPLPDATDPLARNAASQARTVPAAKPGSTPNATPSAAPTEASGMVTMRQNGNLRTDPHGASIRVVSQGTALHVFGQAPGGWYQVGDSAPQGWIHESMLDRH